MDPVETLLVLGFFIGPTLVLAHIAYTVDRVREPLWNVGIYLICGALAVLPALVAKSALRPLSPRTLDDGLLPFFLWMFGAVGLLEESLKCFALAVRAKFDRRLDEPYDWVLYAVTVALGFATVENWLYIYYLDKGLHVAALRSVLAVPAHALFGALMGTRLAEASRLPSAKAWRCRLLAILEPTAWHSTYVAFATLAHPGGAEAGMIVMLWVLYNVVATRVRYGLPFAVHWRR